MDDSHPGVDMIYGYFKEISLRWEYGLKILYSLHPRMTIGMEGLLKYVRILSILKPFEDDDMLDRCF